MTRRTPRLACASLAALLLSSPAHAIFRAYLAIDGSDTNPCTLLQPCRLLPAALAAVDPGGEIWMLDSANYNTGQVDVNKSVSILAIPGAVGSVVATGFAHGLNIVTMGGKVSLRNLVVIPLGTGAFGVNFASGAELTIRDCEFANHAGMGGAIYAQGAAKVAIKDTLVRNSQYGVYLQNGVRATLERVRIENNTLGAYVSNSNAVVANGVISGNTTGVDVYSGGANLSSLHLDQTQVSHNTTGLMVGSFVGGDQSHATVTRSSFAFNGTAIAAQANNQGISTVTLDETSIVRNNTVYQAIAGSPALFSRGNNLVRNNFGGDTLPATPVGGQ